MQEYINLNSMLNTCQEARSYFSSLPDYVRDSIVKRGDNVCNMEDLKSYADNLLKGDG